MNKLIYILVLIVLLVNAAAIPLMDEEIG